MANLLVLVLLGLFMIGAAKLFAATVIGFVELCGKIARLIDHAPNRIIIPVCFTAPIWVSGLLYLLTHF